MQRAWMDFCFLPLLLNSKPALVNANNNNSLFHISPVCPTAHYCCIAETLRGQFALPTFSPADREFVRIVKRSGSLMC